MKSNEWYTPAKYIEAAREVMGSIDLDPASCELANRTVKATTYYTKEQNGLLLPWYGSVWLNPPFSSAGNRMSQLRWGKKLSLEFHGKRMDQGIITLYTTGKNRWFHELWNLLDGPMSIPYKRVYFLRPDGSKVELIYAVYFAYIGPNEQKFIDVFSRFGTVARRVSPSLHIPIQLALDNLVSVSLLDSD